MSLQKNKDYVFVREVEVVLEKASFLGTKNIMYIIFDTVRIDRGMLAETLSNDSLYESMKMDDLPLGTYVENLLQKENVDLGIVHDFLESLHNKNPERVKIYDLSKVKNCIKITGYVNSTDYFTEQPKVINPASETLSFVFGNNGKHTRAAISANSLPLGASVEIEALFEI